MRQAESLAQAIRDEHAKALVLGSIAEAAAAIDLRHAEEIAEPITSGIAKVAVR